MATCTEHGIETAVHCARCQRPMCDQCLESAGLCQECRVEQLADPARTQPGMFTGLSPFVLGAALVILLMLFAACAGCSAVLKALPDMVHT